MPRIARICALALAGAVALGAVAWLGLSLSSWPDWTIEAQPSVDALLRGQFETFLRGAPAYGGSLLMRAPFMALAGLWHGGGRAVYTLGAVPCLAALAGLGVWLARSLADRGAGLGAQALALVLCVANPLTVPALQLGHPEELLGAALVVAAVLCAQRDRAVLAGLLVGVAIANKSWAAVAAGPVLVALSRDRGRALAAMLVAAGALTVPFVLVRVDGVSGRAAAVGVGSSDIFNPWQLWWFLGAPAVHAGGSVRIPPPWLDELAHLLIVALSVPTSLAYALRHRAAAARRGPKVLLLLALLLLLRCALDPWDISYYALPFLVVVLTWECRAHARPPLVTLLATFVAWLVLQETSSLLGDAQNTLAAIFALAAVPAIVGLGLALFGRPRREPAMNALPVPV